MVAWFRTRTRLFVWLLISSLCFSVLVMTHQLLGAEGGTARQGMSAKAGSTERRYVGSPGSPSLAAVAKAKEKERADRKKKEQQPAKKYTVNGRYLLRPIDKQANSKVVLLTFDDAPYTSKSTPPMLKVLDKHKVKAIFFVNGYLVERAPKLLKSIHEHGHMIGNHTWGHANLGEKNKHVITQEIVTLQSQVKQLTGSAPRFFRPPFGVYNEKVKTVLGEQTLQLLYWSNDSVDWMHRNVTSPKVVSGVLKQLEPGSIILMHDLPATAKVLDELLTKVKKKGYTFIDPREL